MIINPLSNLKVEHLKVEHLISEAFSDILKDFESNDDWTVNPGQVRDMFVLRVFNSRLGWIAHKHPDSRKLAAEKVVAALMKNGIGKDKVRFSKGIFRVQLSNMEYWIYKKDDGCYVRPGNSANCSLSFQRTSPRGIANYIINFDKDVPELERRSKLLFDAIQEQQIQQRQAAMVKELSENILMPLVEQYLKPLGISVQYDFDDDCSNVSLYLRQVFSAHLDIPMEQLAEKLKDTEAILSELTPEPAMISKPTKKLHHI